MSRYVESVSHQAAELGDAPDLLPLIGQDDVAFLEARLLGGRALGDVLDQRPSLLGELEARDVVRGHLFEGHAEARAAADPDHLDAPPFVLVVFAGRTRRRDRHPQHRGRSH